MGSACCARPLLVAFRSPQLLLMSADEPANDPATTSVMIMSLGLVISLCYNVGKSEMMELVALLVTIISSRSDREGNAVTLIVELVMMISYNTFVVLFFFFKGSVKEIYGDIGIRYISIS